MDREETIDWCPSLCETRQALRHKETIPLPLPLTSRIAAELYDRIIDHLHSCKPALSTCSTVCKAWLPSCRYHLFSKVKLRLPFVQFLRSSSHAEATISPFISRVTVGELRGLEQRAEFNDIILFLITLERVDELYLEDLVWDYLSADAANSLMDTRTKLSLTLTKLVMVHVRFPSFTLLTEFIGRFTMLRELTFCTVTWGAPALSISRLPSASPTGLLDEAPFPMRLQKVDIRAFSKSPVLRWLLSGIPLGVHEQAVPALRTIVLPDILPSELTLVGPLLRSVGCSLQHLELGFLIIDSNSHATQEAFGAIDLSHNLDLRVVGVHQLILYQFPPPTPSFSTTTPDSPYAWLAPFLAQIKSPNLTEVKFNVWLSMEYQLDLINWIGLAKVFTNPHFRKLRRLEFEVCGMGRDSSEVKGWIRRRLPEWEDKELSVRLVD